MPRLDIHRKFGLSRSPKQRKHLLRTMLTQLVEHERINTTIRKAQFLRVHAEKLISITKKVTRDNDGASRNIQGKLTTRFAVAKVINEICPRFREKRCNYTRIVKLGYRKGDNAQMAYIEYIGNDLEKYEQSKRAEIPDKFGDWQSKTLAQEKAYMSSKLDEAIEDFELSELQLKEKVNAGELSESEFAKAIARKKLVVDFFQEKIKRVDHDIFIGNKSKFDLIKFFPRA